jgi:transcriptional regulator with XRE-family HTH domain
MTRTVHSALARILCEHVRALREAAHMTQRDLAAALGREHGMVARIELGERRVDLVEAYQLFGALGANPEREVAALMRKFEKTARQLSKVR